MFAIKQQQKVTEKKPPIHEQTRGSQQPGPDLALGKCYRRGAELCACAHLRGCTHVPEQLFHPISACRSSPVKGRARRESLPSTHLGKWWKGRAAHKAAFPVLKTNIFNPRGETNNHKSSC